MSIVSKIIKRLLLPNHLYQVVKRQRQRKKHQRVFDDAQLKLYSEILPNDFLHYGYFEKTEVNPAEMSINDIYRAQQQYGVQLIDLIKDKTQPVLDIGCGMGGLIALMNEQNLKPVALTPDVNQAKHIREKYSETKLLEMKFEDINANDYEDYFGTVITSESLQYLDLDIALPFIAQILKQGGQWIACDYFKQSEKGEKSGHNWDLFTEKLALHGFKLTYQRDITGNVLPTIAYVHFWATRIGLPVKNFALEKLKVKAPGYYYAAQEAIPDIEAKIQKNIDSVTPEIFAAHKRYILMVIERK